MVAVNGQYTISKGNNSAIIFIWTNTATNGGPTIVACGRKEMHVVFDGNTLKVGTDTADALSLLIDETTGDLILKNNMSTIRYVGYYMFKCE